MHHTSAALACQSPVRHPSSLSENVSSRLSNRYGAEALAHGYSGIPNIVIEWYADLGVSTGEWEVIIALWRSWTSMALPAPAIPSLAQHIHKSVRTVERHLGRLQQAGLLQSVPRYSPSTGAQLPNAYDLRPLIDAATRRSQQATQTLGTPADPVTPVTLPPTELSPLLRIEKEKNDHDTSPQPPQDAVDATTGGDAGPAPGKEKEPPVRPADPAEAPVAPEAALLDASVIAAITDHVLELSGRFGDETPSSSVSRALNLYTRSPVSPGSFLQALCEAAERTRQAAPRITRRRRDGGTNAMPYLFMVWADLLCPARPRSETRAARSARRTSLPPTAPDDGVSPSPITEDYPVWRAVLDELHGTVTSGNFDMHFAPTRVLDHQGDVLRIVVPSASEKQWLERMGCRATGTGCVAKALRSRGYDTLHIDYVVHHEGG